jgi:hypothetical protein
MAVENGNDPISDDEMLYRRIPVDWYSTSTGQLDDQAFAPHKTRDATGLSVVRAKYKLIEEAAKGRQGKSYYVAVFRAGDLRREGMEIVPRPKGGDPGHAELPDLNASNRKSDITVERQQILVRLCREIKGPFHS